MNDQTLKEKIRSFLSSYIKTAFTDDEDVFKAGYVNSLFAMQLVKFVEKNFKVKIENGDLQLSNFNSVNNIIQFVQRKLEPV